MLITDQTGQDWGVAQSGTRDAYTTSRPAIGVNFKLYQQGFKRRKRVQALPAKADGRGGQHQGVHVPIVRAAALMRFRACPMVRCRAAGGLPWLDDNGSHHGLLGRVVRWTQFLTGEREALSQDEDAVAAQFLVATRRPPQRDVYTAVLSAFQQAGARLLRPFGPSTIEEFE